MYMFKLLPREEMRLFFRIACHHSNIGGLGLCFSVRITRNPQDGIGRLFRPRYKFASQVIGDSQAVP